MKCVYRAGFYAPSTGGAAIRSINKGIFMEPVCFQGNIFFRAGCYALTATTADTHIDRWHARHGVYNPRSICFQVNPAFVCLR